MSQLGLGLGLSNVSSLLRFSPLDLDPYLLFDTQSSMIGTFENPTLDLDPANPSTLDVITATRAGVATYTDADGLIQSATPNTTRVDYTQGAELTPTKFQHITNTDFTSGWIDFGVAQTSNYGISPDGTNSSTRLVFSDASKTFYRFVLHGSGSETNTLYVKGTAGETIKFGRAAVVNAGEIFTLTGDWQRLESVSNTGNQFSISTYSGVTARDLEIWGPQVEEGTTASSFVANTTGSPKFITGATYGPRVPMILVEPSSENLVTYSEDISNAAWTKFGEGTGVAPTVTPDFGTSPDGTVSASRVQFNKGSGTTTGDQSTIFDAEATSSGATTTKSVYLKSNTNEAYEMVIYEVTSASGTNVKKITVTPDWQRFDVYGAISSTTTGIAIGLREINVSGLSNTADVLVWGAQLETGSVSTSYIPTSGGDAAARTRASDELVISGSDFDFYNQSEGTFYVESNTRLSGGQPFIVSVDNGVANRINIYEDYTTVKVVVITNGTVEANFNIGTRPSANTLNRTALSYKTNNAQASLNGGSVVTDTSVSIPTSINRMNIGTRFGQADIYKLNGHIKRLIYWPYHSDSL